MTEATEAGDFFGSVPDAREGLARAGYLADDATSTAVFLADRLGMPLLVEGPAGVGKTDLAKGDDDTQALEDAMCLVFLELQLADVAARLDEEKLVSVLAKTAKKMSATALGHAAALPLDDHGRALLARAMNEGTT